MGLNLRYSPLEWSDKTKSFTVDGSKHPFSKVLAFGTSANPIDIGSTPGNRALEIYSTSSSTHASTSVRPIFLRHTVTGVGGVGHRAEFHTRCGVAAGGWINALKGYMEFDTSGTGGRTTGLASAICAELKMPNAAVSTGHYYPMEVEFVGQTNSGPGVHHGFITTRASGTLTNFNASGFFLHVNGLSAGATAMLSADSQTLKCLVGASTTRYMLLSQAANTLSLTLTDTAGGSYGVRVVTTLTSIAAVACRAVSGEVVYTPATVASGGSVPIGVAGKVTLSATCESDLYMWGVQGQLHLANTSVITCSQIAAGRFVLTADADPTITSGIISGIYIDNLIATSLAAGADWSCGMRIANHGGGMDDMISFYTPNVTNLFHFESATAMISNITGGGVHGGTIQRIRCDFAGTTYYMIMSTAPTS